MIAVSSFTTLTLAYIQLIVAATFTINCITILASGPLGPTVWTIRHPTSITSHDGYGEKRNHCGTCIYDRKIHTLTSFSQCHRSHKMYVGQTWSSFSPGNSLSLCNPHSTTFHNTCKCESYNPDNNCDRRFPCIDSM